MQQDVLKFFIMDSGEQCVEISSLLMNHAWSAGCLDLHGEIKLTIATTLPIVVQSGWTGCNAVVQRGMLQNVHTVVGVFTTVNTMKMSLSPVLAPRLK